MNQAYQKAPRISKVTVEAAGYRWRVYGLFAGGYWRCHLVELLGAYMLDIPVDRRLGGMLRQAVAQFYRLPLATIRPIRQDLIVADTV